LLACEPENRLVARTLEARWETRLTGLADAEAALAAQRSAQPELPSPGQLAATIADLPALWSAPATSDKDRKRLLRTLLADVTITPSAADPTQISVGLRWKSGASQQIHLTRRKNTIQLRCTDPAAIELARRIGPGLDNNALAGALNDAGHRTGTGQPFDGVAAANLRNYHRIPYPGLLEAGELTPRQVAQLTGVSTGTIHYWINAGYLAARRGPAGRWCIPFPPDVEAACRERAAGPLPGDRHGGFGERSGETGRWQHRNRAPGRLNSEPSSRVPCSHRKAGEPARRAGSITCRCPALLCMVMTALGRQEATLASVDASPADGIPSELRSRLADTIELTLQVTDADTALRTPWAHSQAGQELDEEERRRPEPQAGSWPWLLAPMIARLAFTPRSRRHRDSRRCSVPR
jgi:hypothetical protein